MYLSAACFPLLPISEKYINFYYLLRKQKRMQNRMRNYYFIYIRRDLHEPGWVGRSVWGVFLTQLYFIKLRNSQPSPHGWIDELCIYVCFYIYIYIYIYLIIKNYVINYLTIFSINYNNSYYMLKLYSKISNQN